MPSTPPSLARRASSGWQMPLTSSGRSVSERSQPQVVPGQGVSEDLYPAQHRALRVLLGRALQAGAEDRVAGVVGQAVPAQLGEVRRAQVARAPAGDPGVEGDDDALEAGRLGAMHQAGGQLAVGRRVQLEEPGRVAEFGGDVFHRVDGQRRGHHRDPGAGRRAGGGQVAVAVLGAQPDDADRRHEQRATATSGRTARRTGRAAWRRRTCAGSGPSARRPRSWPAGCARRRHRRRRRTTPTAAAPSRPWPPTPRRPSAATARFRPGPASRSRSG